MSGRLLVALYVIQLVGGCAARSAPMARMPAPTPRPDIGAFPAPDVRPTPFPERIAYLGVTTTVVLHPSHRRLWVDGFPLGDAPLSSDERLSGVEQELREPFGSVHGTHGGGFAFLTPDGDLFAVGSALPRAGPSLLRVELGGPVRYVSASDQGICASVGVDTYCWGSSASSIGSTLLRLEGHDEPVTEIAIGAGRLCAVGGDRVLYCWEWPPHVAPADAAGTVALTRPIVVARGVERVVGGYDLLCFVHGAARTLRCWGPMRATLHDVGLHQVTDLGVGYANICAIGQSARDADPWLYCWGWHGGWLAVGPHGFASATWPPTLQIFDRPRPVLPVARGTILHVLGQMMCLETGASVRCDPSARHLPMVEYYGVEIIPESTRPHPGLTAVQAEVFLH